MDIDPLSNVAAVPASQPTDVAAAESDFLGALRDAGFNDTAMHALEPETVTIDGVEYEVLRSDEAGTYVTPTDPYSGTQPTTHNDPMSGIATPFMYDPASLRGAQIPSQFS